MDLTHELGFVGLNKLIVRSMVYIILNNVLDEFDNGTQVSKPKVNGLVNDLCNFMCDTASTVFGTNSKNRHHNKK